MKCESVTERSIGKAKILIAENNFAQACLMKDFLEMSGHDVILSENGKAVMNDVEMHHPDVILLDRAMADIDGTVLCRLIKCNRETTGIPIIILAENISLRDKIESLSAGADDFIAKPYNDQELIALICARLRAKSEWDELRQKTRSLEEMLGRVETLAHIDPLTGLFNRRRCDKLLAVEFKRAKRYEHPLSCLILDIDHFKEVNDRHGHLAGDYVLKETAKIIRSSIREFDIAARWGGEEFIILNPNTEKKNAQIVGEKIRKAVGSKSFQQIGGKITVSIGVAAIPDTPVDTAAGLVQAADFAMYHAKKNGKNQVCVAD